MANKKITELNEATSISGTDWLVMVDVANDETKKIHANQVGGNIPIQDTAPQDPEEDDLWIDTSEPEELSANIVNEASNSTTDAYSCNYTNALVDFIRTNKTTEPVGTNRDCLMITSETTKGINLFYNPANAPVANNMIMWKSFITDYNAPNGYWTYIVVAIALDSHTMWLNAYHNAIQNWTGWQQL